MNSLVPANVSSNIRNKESAFRTSGRFSLSCLNLEKGEELQNQI